MTLERPSLQLVHNALDPAVEWSWFCGRCALPHPDPPHPAARVCPSCGLGLLLETREDMLPGARDAFLVVDRMLLVQGMSPPAERLLSMAEEMAVNRPLGELLIGADAERGGPRDLAQAVASILSGGDQPAAVHVRPWNTFGVRLRAQIGACGPPRAALVVLGAGPPSLRPIGV